MTNEKDRDEKKVVNTGGGAYIGGNVNTGGGKIVGRDEVVTHYTVGDVAALAELKDELKTIRELLGQSGLEADVAESVEDDLKKVEQQTAKETPNGNLIKNRLQGINDLLSGTAGVAETVNKILTAVSKAATIAGALFP